MPLRLDGDDDIPLGVRRAMWFIQNGAPAHFSIRASVFKSLVKKDLCFAPGQSRELYPIDFSALTIYKYLFINT